MRWIWLPILFLAGSAASQDFDASIRQAQVEGRDFYAAQKMLFDSDCQERKWLKDHDDIKAFVDRVYADEWFRKQFRNARKPRLGFSQREGWAYTINNTLYFPKSGACNYAVLHEITHHLTPGAGHEIRFAQVFIVMLRRFAGEESVAVLRRGYESVGKNSWIPRTGL
jgi:putative metallohydrolase (TIGR04338 family)